MQFTKFNFELIYWDKYRSVLGRASPFGTHAPIFVTSSCWCLSGADQGFWKWRFSWFLIAPPLSPEATTKVYTWIFRISHCTTLVNISSSHVILRAHNFSKYPPPPLVWGTLDNVNQIIDLRAGDIMAWYFIFNYHKLHNYMSTSYYKIKT